MQSAPLSQFPLSTNLFWSRPLSAITSIISCPLIFSVKYTPSSNLVYHTVLLLFTPIYLLPKGSSFSITCSFVVSCKSSLFSCSSLKTLYFSDFFFLTSIRHRLLDRSASPKPTLFFPWADLTLVFDFVIPLSLHSWRSHWQPLLTP